MLKNDGYALLIGVDDYSTFDRSRGQEAGTSDLLGSRNDVRNFWKLCRLLGMKAENIRVLTSPPIPCEELEGASPASVGPATAAAIVAEVEWLATMLAQPARPTGLMTYSGHGDLTATQGLVLCPSDLGYRSEAALENAVSFGALNAVLDRHGAGDRLTVVLDTCHSGGAVAEGERAVRIGRPLSLLQRAADDAASAAPVEEINARVLAAAGRDQVAYQSLFDGAYRGVFSWAVSAAMAQWKVSPEGGGARLDVSYGKLVETTQRLVAALWFDQRPELRGPAELAAVPVFGLAGGATSERPNGRFLTQQIDPANRGYLIYTIAQGGVQIGVVLVTHTAGGGYDANREYWYMTSNMSMGAAVAFTGGTPQDWSTPPGSLGTLSFKTRRDATWTLATPSGTLLVESNPLTGENIAINWQMTVSHGSWGGSITWWHNSQTDIFGPGVTDTLTPGTPPGGTWYKYVTAPLP